VFDERVILGARSSKVSESKLDGFETINADDTGQIRIEMLLNSDIPKRHDKPIVPKLGFEPDICTVTLTPGSDPTDLIKLLENDDLRGIILR